MISIRAAHPPQEEHVVTWFGSSEVADRVAPRLPAQGAAEPGFSIVICTYQRADSLVRFLDSLQGQERQPARLVIVDASPDAETEQRIRGYTAAGRLATPWIYVRVTGPLRGLTRQRNFGVRLVATELVAFFDDDIVLLPGCLREMVGAHKSLADQVAGVAAHIQTPQCSPDRLWRLRLLLRMVDNLRPGSYQRSGFSIPWSFMPPTQEIVEGDYLPGGATMWKTALIRELGFPEAFQGYALGEDLDFSLRARRRGKLVVAGAARLRHLHEWTGKPDYFRLGYMLIYNKYGIHQHALPDRSWRDGAWFVYAWTLDTLLLIRYFGRAGQRSAAARQMAGRLKAGCDLWNER